VRIALTVLAWAWTGAAGALSGAALGVSAPGSGVSGWASSGQETIIATFTALLTPDAIAIGLIWVGAAVLLGALLDLAGAAAIAIAGLVWSAGLFAALGAAGVEGAVSPLLAPALPAAVGWICWQRAGRPPLRPLLADFLGPAASPRLALGGDPVSAAADCGRLAPARHPQAPLADERARASEAAARHVRAALHGAGSRSGLP
jgi:hypothetical protein